MSQNSIHVELTDEGLVEFIRSKVESGEYASTEEVISESLLALHDEEAEQEQWLQAEVARSYDEYQANPENALTLEQVCTELEKQRTERAKLRP